ncbi:hypothetical protein M422DRAFT_50764 [Sphaerobolus stellatus SS14]|uniref:Uncharacterized protein n=1 Tax=Sphaerobolus stellatus (strain SS14) TaxID=990650 RepID=A0A0C9U2D6_SPHS4|nr:hypothetical protein M422DRAFT_50764 [Sphaerobolus stellatus SS14]
MWLSIRYLYGQASYCLALVLIGQRPEFPSSLRVHIRPAHWRLFFRLSPEQINEALKYLNPRLRRIRMLRLSPSLTAIFPLGTNTTLYGVQELHIESNRDDYNINIGTIIMPNVTYFSAKKGSLWPKFVRFGGEGLIKLNDGTCTPEEILAILGAFPKIVSLRVGYHEDSNSPILNVTKGCISLPRLAFLNIFWEPLYLPNLSRFLLALKTPSLVSPKLINKMNVHSNDILSDVAETLDSTTSLRD